MSDWECTICGSEVPSEYATCLRCPRFNKLYKSLERAEREVSQIESDIKALEATNE